MLYLYKVDQIKKIENVFGNYSRLPICLQHKPTIFLQFRVFGKNLSSKKAWE